MFIKYLLYKLVVELLKNKWNFFLFKKILMCVRLLVLVCKMKDDL